MAFLLALEEVLHRLALEAWQEAWLERREALLQEIPCAEDITMIEFSAETGEGVEEIRAILEDIAEDEAE